MTGQNLMNITVIRDSKLSSKESDLEEVILSIYLHHCSLLSVLIQLICLLVAQFWAYCMWKGIPIPFYRSFIICFVHTNMTNVVPLYHISHIEQISEFY